MALDGQWHGKQYYFGLHYDLHASAKDTQLGLHCSPRELVPMLKLANPDFIQTDCKGHPGWTSWFSKTPDASVPPKLKKDALKGWCEAVRKLGLPLHCHYSGVWDAAAGQKHPEWTIVGPDGKRGRKKPYPGQIAPPCELMCPRSDYATKLMIPQMLELIDHYGVDGFWIDGELWAAEPCYCSKCRKAFTEKTGIKNPPKTDDDANWQAWREFTLESFYEHVKRYCDAVHGHKPGVLICSNWLQTFKNPGEPWVPTDWISGDNVWVYGLDGSRCEARFLSTRNKPWDIMLWGFYCSHGMGVPDSPWTTKPPQMLMQEAAVLLAFGGNVQVYTTQQGLRDGRLPEWKMRRLGQVSRFVHKRRSVCQGTETVPQIAVLHSEHHIRKTIKGRNLMWTVDAAPVQGATFSLLENHYGVDVMDEWALLGRLGEFPCVVAPEAHEMSDQMVAALKDYVRAGGKLIVSGAESFARFGSAFLGVTAGKIVEDGQYAIPAGDGGTPLHSKRWRLVKTRSAKALAPIGKPTLMKDHLLAHPAATINKVGKGSVLYIPANVFRAFDRMRHPLLRQFVGEMTRKLTGTMEIEVDAPLCIDVTLRRKGDKTIVHLVNRASGIPNQPNNGGIDEIPPVGPIKITIKTSSQPTKVALAFEKRQPLTWKHSAGKLTITVPSVHIHEAVVVQ